mgnify:CR=1 FL=1
MTDSVKGALLTMFGGMCWGVSGCVGQYLFTRQGMDSTWLVPIRLFLAGVILCIYYGVRNWRQLVNPWRSWRNARDLVIYGLAGVSFCQFTYFLTIQLSSAGVGTILQDLSPVLILLVVCLMTIAGAFLVNSVNRFYLNEFYTQMVEVFSQDTEFIRDLVTAREGETDGVQAIDEILVAKMGPLGVDGKNRNYYLLDGDTGQILSSSDDDAGDTLEEITPNLLIALNEKREGDESDLTASYMDLALPISRVLMV